jgi:osmoprotectant transport system substrate-binding protein
MPRSRREFLERLGATCAVSAAGLSGCTGSPSVSTGPTTVRVGSKAFAEQRILGYLAYERLRPLDGIQAVDEIGYGDSRENWGATAAGTKHLYWEYTGTAWRELPPRRERRVTDPRRLYELAAADARERGLRMAEPASFSNEYVLVADRDWSERTGVETISDLAAHVDAGNAGFGIAVNEDFYHREDAWEGVTEYYGIGPDARERVESGRFVVTSVGLTYELLRDGRAQVASGFDTDPQLDRDSVRTLEDDREYFIPYQPAPTAHAPTVADHPVLFESLAPVVSALDEATIRDLNREVLLEGRTARTVAAEFLDRTVGAEG